MLFPCRLLLAVTADCPYITEPWSGVPQEWGPPLPPLGELDGSQSFADVYVAWNEDGLYVAARIDKEGPIVGNRRRPQSGDGMQLWVDTQPDYSGHRATRYCYHFVILPGAPGCDKPLAWQQHIRRARQRPSLADPEAINVSVDQGDEEYLLRVGLGTDVLSGFEPQVGVELGFHYLIHDTAAGRQLWSCPPQVPYDRDPDFWGRLRLVS